jgi:hypothetical protein
MAAVLANTNITLDNTSAITIPGTPSAGQTVIYPKADKLIYYKDDAGRELPLGKVIQVVNFQTGAVATGTTVIPQDNTIPQITEGDQYMILAITPTSALNKLLIQVVAMHGTPTDNSWIASALFVGSTANALASCVQYESGIDAIRINTFSHSMVAGATTELTFRVRSGQDTAGTLTFNGYNSAGKYGGSLASSITITEYTA